MTDHDQRHEHRAEVLLLFVVVIWAANYPLAKWGISGMNVFVFNAIRFIVAAFIVVGVFLHRSQWIPVAKDDWRKFVNAGFIANVAYQIIFLLGLSMTTAGNSAVLLSTSPLWTIFLDAKIHKQPISRRMWIGMALSLCGVTMIIFGSGKQFDFGAHALIGDLIMLTAAIIWGLNTTLQKPLLVHYSVLQVTTMMMIVGAIGLSLAAIPASISFRWSETHWTYYAAAITSGALSIGVGNILWTNGVKRLGPGRTANFNNLVPVLAVVISSLSLHEEISAIQIPGIGITMLGVWVARGKNQFKSQN